MRLKVERKKKGTYRLVVDASIAQSAGEGTDPSSESYLCRETLNSIKGTQLRLVMTVDIGREWDRHQSAWSRDWRTKMMVRQQVEVLRSLHDTQMRDDLLKLTGNVEAKRLAASDDVILLEAALATDKRVLSKERIAREFFADCAKRVRKLGHILWANPCRPEENSRDWLRSGAPDEPGRRLGNFRVTKPGEGGAV
jgi:hypothetical protein